MPKGLNRVLMTGLMTAVFVAIIFRVPQIRDVVIGKS